MLSRTLSQHNEENVFKSPPKFFYQQDYALEFVEGLSAVCTSFLFAMMQREQHFGK